jgi:hypothetical protein
MIYGFSSYEIKKFDLDTGMKENFRPPQTLLLESQKQIPFDWQGRPYKDLRIICDGICYSYRMSDHKWNAQAFVLGNEEIKH